jgi:hypothetical protein
MRLHELPPAEAGTPTLELAIFGVMLTETLL